MSTWFGDCSDDPIDDTARCPEAAAQERPAAGRPYQIFVNGILTVSTRGEFDDVRARARELAREKPGARILVEDRWCDEKVVYQCEQMHNGRLWATGER